MCVSFLLEVHIQLWSFSLKCPLLCRFDKRITSFAEEKFKRDGIDVKTGSMVVKVSDKEISTKERGKGEISSLNYGMVVWSTGIGTRPVIMDFMKQINQVTFFSCIRSLQQSIFFDICYEVDTQQLFFCICSEQTSLFCLTFLRTG